MSLTLDAVNEILEAVNEFPVTALDTGGDSQAAIAENVLDRERRRILTQGWAENTEAEVELEPDVDDHITLDADILWFDPTGTSAALKVARRNGRLYSLDEAGDEWEENVFLSVRRLLDLDDLSEALRTNIVASAAQVMQRRVVGGQVQDRFLAEEKAEKQHAAGKDNQEAEDVNVLTNRLGRYPQSGGLGGSQGTPVHNHDDRYSLLAHDHDSDYSAIDHDHDADYEALGHDHDSDYINKTNTDPFTPSADYHPATKKYIDDNIPAVDPRPATNEGNIAILGFRLAAQGSLSVQGMIDGIIDEFEDETGVDGADSTNESYNATDDLYGNSITVDTDFTAGGTASASSEHSAPYLAAKAFDDSNATTWISGVGVGTGWIQYDLGVGNSDTLYKCTIRARNSSPNGSPKDFTIKGSDNGSDWTTLATVTGETGWGISEQREFIVDDVSDYTAYRYFRIDITATDGGAEMSIAEIEFIDATMENMTLISEPVEALAEPTDGTIVLLVDPPVGAVLNTDIKSYVSLDDGNEYDQITLEAVADYGDGVSVYQGTVTLTDSGDQTMRWKITTHNNEYFEIHGVSLSWR